MDDLRKVKVAILVENGFEQSELREPRKVLDGAGATTLVVSAVPGRVRGWNHTNWGEEVEVDLALDRAHPEDFDALLLPGGVMNPDRLRMQPAAVGFVQSFFDTEKPIAAICHAPWTIIEAGAARGRRIASWPSLKTDLQNAGAEWVDEEVVVDGNLVTSRKPADLPAFNREMVALFARATAAAARAGIEVGFHTFAADGGEEFGAVREVRPSGLVVYVENAGDFVVPLDAVDAVHSQKVILRCERLDPALRDAIAHAHDAEVPGV